MDSILMAEVRRIIAAQLHISSEEIRPESNLRRDLCLDSLDLVELVTVFDRHLGNGRTRVPSSLPRIATVQDIVDFLEMLGVSQPHPVTVNGSGASSHPTNGNGANGYGSSNGNGANGHATNGNGASGHPTNGNGANGYGSSNGNGASGHTINFYTRDRHEQWFARPAPNTGARLRLFCFPYAGGSAAIYHKWPEGLPDHVELLAIQLPGRGSRFAEPPYERMGPLVDALASAMLPYLDRPYALFGHSLGALVAFEVARRLRQEGAPLPVHLIASGCRAPIHPEREPVHHLPDPLLIDRLRRYRGTPDELLRHEELMKLLLPAVRADFAINETYHYRPGEPLPCPISVLGGLSDHAISRAALADWQQETSGQFNLHLLPGDHFFLNSARATLLHLLVAKLETPETTSGA